MANESIYGKRRKAVKLHATGKNISQICTELNMTYFQVWNALKGRVNLYPKPRADKGHKRTAGEAAPDSDETLKGTKAFKDFENVDEVLQDQLMIALRDLTKTKMSADVRVKLIKDISAIQKNIEVKRLENWMKRPEAVLIVRIMRRFKPDLSDDEIIKIYSEEYEKIQRDI